MEVEAKEAAHFALQIAELETERTQEKKGGIK